MKEQRLSICLRILLEISEIIVFCVIWILLGPLFIDVNKHISVDIFGCKEPIMGWLVYGIFVYLGGRVIYLCISKITKVIKTIV